MSLPNDACGTLYRCVFLTTRGFMDLTELSKGWDIIYPAARLIKTPGLLEVMAILRNNLSVTRIGAGLSCKGGML